MKNKLFHYLFISSSLLLFICLFFSCREKKESATTTADTQIEWTKKTWNFGDLVQGEEVSHTFYFKNTGGSNLIIKKIETGCGCTTVNYDKAPIPPGKQGKIEIAFNSTGRYGKQYKEICIFANVPQKQETLSFTANVKEK